MNSEMHETGNHHLTISGLHVHYQTGNETVHAINGIDLILDKGETLGIDGETGAGKTTLALSILKLLPRVTGKIKKGSIIFDGEDLVPAHEAKMRMVRGARIGMIFQDPMSSLNPVMIVYDQIAEVIRLHSKLDAKQIEDRVTKLLDMVGIDQKRKYDYPHQFSGGMKQRVVIAMALACEPAMLIADEPTTALDVTIQAQILNIISDLKKKLNTTMILITHDLGIVVEMCDNVAIMYGGEFVEYGSVYDIYNEKIPHHPYTEGLFGSVPDLTRKTDRLTPIDGLMPDPTNLPPGCSFQPRCPKALGECNAGPVPSYENNKHIVKCHLFRQWAGESK